MFTPSPSGMIGGYDDVQENALASTRHPRRGATKRFAIEIVEHSDLRVSQTHGLLEVVFQSELNDTSSRGSTDLAIERAGQQRGRVSQVDVVEQVEELRPELEVRLSRR